MKIDIITIVKTDNKKCLYKNYYFILICSFVKIKINMIIKSLVTFITLMHDI